MRLPMICSALLLTGVNLVLRMVGTWFQVYLSGRIGPEGIGLLQLVMSVNSLAVVAGIGGIRTAAMYLTAQELGQHREENTACVLSGCFQYSIVFSGLVSTLLWISAPMLAEHWIGNAATVPALRLTAAFLPTVCLVAVMTGYYTAANRIGMLAAVEVAEQLLSMVLTMALLSLRAGHSAERACLSVVLGSHLSSCVTLLFLFWMRTAQSRGTKSGFSIRSRLLSTALPLASADILRSGINTLETLLVPRRLALYAGEASPLAAFGLVSGMVFPVLMFPACILFGLSELLIPELARCAAAGKDKRINELVQRGLYSAAVYGLFCGGVLFLLGVPLCQLLYNSREAGQMLCRYALLVPFLYTDILTDAMTKGLGQQKICVRYNILTSALDVAGLFLLLPRYGMQGYYFSFAVTHLLNFLLSLRRLCRITQIRLRNQIITHHSQQTVKFR